MMRITLLVLAAMPWLALAADESPYAGQETRAIKSLSADDIEALKSGEGMGFAKVAELNHFPGPRHVLDLADVLELTPQQIVATEAIFQEMHRNAMSLGEALLAAESKLETEFEQKSIDSEALESALLEIEAIRAQLRFVHLAAHLDQERLLTVDQVSKYDAIRGYRASRPGHDSHSHDRH